MTHVMKYILLQNNKLTEIMAHNSHLDMLTRSVSDRFYLVKEFLGSTELFLENSLGNKRINSRQQSHTVKEEHIFKENAFRFIFRKQ